MIKIVICGAGFGGLNTALRLEKKFRGRKDISLTLIDKRDYHVFSPSLYEVATAEEEMTSVEQLEKSIAVPFQELLVSKRITFIKGEILEVDRARRAVITPSRSVEYDYVILAMGSRSEYFNIVGAEAFALPLKTLSDAFRIRNALEFAVQAHRQDAVKQYVRFIVAGGGYTGVELAAEMAKLADIIAWKNGYPREKIEIVVVEAANQLVPGFDMRTSRDIFQRLLELGVHIKLLSPIFQVDQQFIQLISGERIAYDALVWTTGVRAQACALDAPLAANKRGQLETDEYLRVKGETHVFAIGDMACIHGAGASFVPTTAQAADAEAAYLAESFPLWLQNKKPQAFRLSGHPFIVSVGGKWALFKSEHFYFTGYFAYLLRFGADLRYFAGLLGWWKAARFVLFDAELYSRND